MDTILKLQDTVHNSLQQLLSFKDIWIRYENLSDKVEGWTREAEKNLQYITSQDLPAGNVRQFWVIILNNKHIDQY
jgi:nesprin-1